MLKRLLFLAIFLLNAAIVLAQDNSASDISYRITTQQVNVRECPQLDCTLLHEYAQGAILFVQAVETGEEYQGTSDWLRIQDVLTGEIAYIHAGLTEEFTPQDWMIAPVVPQVTDTARDIYQRGLEMGNQPDKFSKVGDCQNVSSFFLSVYDVPEEYSLGQYSNLQSTVDNFSESWSRVSASVDNGFNVASVLSPLWSDPDVCEAGENPLQCEYRINQPSITIISMETWWAQRPAEEYEDYLKQIVEFWIDHGVVPILATKADNLEGDYGLNQAVYRVAQEYDVPLWNFWLAIQALPGNGLSEDDFHLTFARNFFDDPVRMKYSWPIRNLTALQAIDAVYQGLQSSGDNE